MSASLDLAGYCPVHPNYLQIRARINRLIDRYLSIDTLSLRLADLPTQFSNPHQRHWEPINLKAIDRSQIIGVDPDLFILILMVATEIEAPIREYSQESWHYMQAVHPQMARFMGGELNADGSIKVVGIWEKEERQHAPLFSKIYQQLTGEKPTTKPNSVAGYQPIANPLQAVYHHAVSRISTEWGATSVYLWLMAHSTGALQQAIAQPLQDEVNHLAKFWGFSRWAFGESFLGQLKDSSQNLIVLLKHHQGERSQGNEFGRNLIMEELPHAIELAFTFARVMVRLRSWNKELSYSFLRCLLGPAIKLDNLAA
jgi:hypothetical protein